MFRMLRIEERGQCAGVGSTLRRLAGDFEQRRGKSRLTSRQSM